MIIRKKIYPEFFNRIAGKKTRMEWRLADFDLKDGDILFLQEWNPKTKKYTGRGIKKKCKKVIKIEPARFYKISHIKKHGLYIIELK